MATAKGEFSPLHLNWVPSLVLMLPCISFGFIMYHNYTDAENCIRCFYYLGYEAKFAKVLNKEVILLFVLIERLVISQ